MSSLYTLTPPPSFNSPSPKNKSQEPEALQQLRTGEANIANTKAVRPHASASVVASPHSLRRDEGRGGASEALAAENSEPRWIYHGAVPSRGPFLSTLMQNTSLTCILTIIQLQSPPRARQYRRHLWRRYHRRYCRSGNVSNLQTFPPHCPA